VLLDRVDVLGVVDVLEVGLVDDGDDDVLGDWSNQVSTSARVFIVPVGLLGRQR
jgi:hypothetical protein